MATIKTIKLKRNPAAGPSVTPPGDEAASMPQADEAAPATEATVSAVPAGLEPVIAIAAPKGQYTAFAVMSLIAFLAVGAVIALQASEWLFYSADPSVWPVK